MKAIIFDLDDTLIDWKNEFTVVLEKTLKELGFNYSSAKIQEINATIDDFENHYLKLTKEDLLNYVNTKCLINLPLKTIELLIEYQKDCIYPLDIADTLEYLSQKYDLYVLTNWFTETQEGRLQNAGILKYFKKVIGADQNYYKPNKEAYDIILKDYQKEDCIFIGDDLDKDIIAPQNIGMQVIWKTNKESKKYPTIKSINDLKNIL